MTPEERAELWKLIADWQANGNSRELSDPTADVWHEAALQLLRARALDGGE